MLPDPPVNVRVVLHDDTVVPVDTVYTGIEDGTHTWCVLKNPPMNQIKELKIDVLPGHTQVLIR
jgi:hypothetical protein